MFLLFFDALQLAWGIFLQQQATAVFLRPSSLCPLSFLNKPGHLRAVIRPLPTTREGRPYTIDMLNTLRTQPVWLTAVTSFVFLLIGWQLLVTVGQYERFILPGPLDVWQQLQIVVSDGRLLRHTLITLSEVIPGLLIGCLVAAPLGYLLAKSPLVERLISPYLIASQAIPIIAIAPLLTIWISSVYWSRVAVATLVVFFPILVNMVVGMRSVPPELYELMHALKADRSQIFRKLEFPAALPIFLAGLKIGATLAVIGALVGEFVQPQSRGLGFLLITARQSFKTDLVFVVLLALATMALSLYGAVALLEKRVLRWKLQQ